MALLQEVWHQRIASHRTLAMRREIASHRTLAMTILARNEQKYEDNNDDISGDPGAAGHRGGCERGSEGAPDYVPEALGVDMIAVCYPGEGEINI